MHRSAGGGEMKPTVPEVMPLVREYYAKEGNICGGSLHIVLDDQNVDDSHIQFCLEYAIEHSDPDGEKLARLLMQMSKTQRLKMAKHPLKRKP